jgi:hypothetical protein
MFLQIHSARVTFFLQPWPPPNLPTPLTPFFVVSPWAHLPCTPNSNDFHSCSWVKERMGGREGGHTWDLKIALLPNTPVFRYPDHVLHLHLLHLLQAVNVTLATWTNPHHGFRLRWDSRTRWAWEQTGGVLPAIWCDRWIAVVWAGASRSWAQIKFCWSRNELLKPNFGLFNFITKVDVVVSMTEQHLTVEAPIHSLNKYRLSNLCWLISPC